ncbi:MAG TPA: sugar ABC transporter permease [Thermomicrobiales bacterium]|nr:sugar ABC transporter permease [Thermomicrobiales bacterium]
MSVVVSHPERDVEQIPEARGRSAADRFLGRDWRIAWLFLLPLILVLVGLVTYPFVTGVWLSLQQKTVGRPASWVGLSNYRELLVGEQYSQVFRDSIRISVVYTGVAVAVKLVLGMCMALLLNERFPGRTMMRALFFLPWAMPTIIVAITWRWIYDGSLNGLFNLIRVEYFGATTLTQYLANPDLALWSVIAVAIWQGTPFYTMMFLSGMQAIPAEQYEAAALDGANVFRRFQDITLPGLTPAIVITSLLSTIWTANSINFIFVLTRGGPANATMTFPMLAYEIGIAGARQLGMAAAVSVLFFPLFIVVIYFLTKRMLSSEAQA